MEHGSGSSGTDQIKKYKTEQLQNVDFESPFKSVSVQTKYGVYRELNCPSSYFLHGLYLSSVHVSGLTKIDCRKPKKASGWKNCDWQSLPALNDYSVFDWVQCTGNRYITGIWIVPDAGWWNNDGMNRIEDFNCCEIQW